MVRSRAKRDPRLSIADLAPVALLGAIAAGVLVVRAAPSWLAVLSLGAILATVVGWVLVSVLWPGRADRVCPACGADAVQRIDRDALVGRRCEACGWRDEEVSAWMLAEEEEEALEPLVLAQRRGAVDTRAPRD